MIPNPFVDFVDPLREFRKLSRFEQRKLVESRMKQKPRNQVQRLTSEDIAALDKILSGEKR